MTYWVNWFLFNKYVKNRVYKESLMLNLYDNNQVKELENKLILKKFKKNNIKDIVPALFLDRDGVIIKDCHYITSPEKVTLEAGILNLIIAAKNSGFKIIVITNQSGISRVYGWYEYMKSQRSYSYLETNIFLMHFIRMDIQKYQK